LERLGGWQGARAAAPTWPPAEVAQPGSGDAVLAGWRMLLDEGRLQDGEPHLAGTARPAVARLSATTASEIGCQEGVPVRISTDRGELTLPVEVTEMPDRVVWVPLNSAGSVHKILGAVGATVRIEPA
ncbi:MAG: molybdopterin dinucleotide binding domain-containing protein, partial [Mycobacterium sp.]